MKKVNVLATVLMVLLVLFTGCSKQQEAGAPVQSAAVASAPAQAAVAPTPVSKQYKIALVLNNLGDQGFNDEAFSGMKMAKDLLIN